MNLNTTVVTEGNTAAYELYNKAYNWFYDKNHGYPQEVINELFLLLAEVNNTVADENDQARW